MLRESHVGAVLLHQSAKRARPRCFVQLTRSALEKCHLAHEAVNIRIRIRQTNPARSRLHLRPIPIGFRSEEHTSELQSLMRISYAVFCLKKTNKNKSQKRKEHTASSDIQETSKLTETQTY